MNLDLEFYQLPYFFLHLVSSTFSKKYLYNFFYLKKFNETFQDFKQKPKSIKAFFNLAHYEI
jgi:hypothetical protein